jgi:hypothetical protein
VARYSGKKRVSEETRDEAMKIARGTQSPGQTKAQTRLIAQGIERGIDLYKKQHKERARALDRRERELRREMERAAGGSNAPTPARQRAGASPSSRAAWLPWVLLALTWTGIAAYWALPLSPG